MARISGRTLSPHAPETLRRLLYDVDVLERSLPGCHGVQEVEPGLYRGAIVLGRRGSAIVRGTLRGEVRVSDLDGGPDCPAAGESGERRCRVEWKARGIAGSVAGFLEVCFTAGAGGGTEVRYAGRMKPRGLFRVIPPGMVDDAVSSFTGQFFGGLSAEPVTT